MQIMKSKRGKYIHGRGYHTSRNCSCGKGILESILPIIENVVAPIAKTAVSSVKLGINSKELSNAGKTAAEEIKSNKILKLINMMENLTKEGKGFAKVF